MEKKWLNIAVRILYLCACIGLPVEAKEVEKTTDKQPRYRLVTGKGTNLCEAYLKQLNAFPVQEPAMICERKLRPLSEGFEKPKWEEINLWQHLDWVYEIDYYLNKVSDYSSYTPKAEKAVSFEKWREGFTLKLNSGKAKPRMYRATLPVEDWPAPIPPVSSPFASRPPLVNRQREWIAYDKGYDRCPDLGDEKLAIHAGGLYSVFLLDGGSSQVESNALLWPASSQLSDILIYRGKTYFTHVIGDSSDPTRSGSIFISKPTPSSGESRWKFYLKNICRIDFSY